ncbi:hypothetical protein FJV18_04075 [Acinetobacter baumannii]|uniref:hypothetical protein n=1 Tax=Acinetobacter baumannii TaxID=470 RepID=UPI001129F35A|nr:hypothetical protein [Acinetobacter baumannii]TPR80636.1 hypothetical protein FJV18_04075 [Acinetobacter baumannii]
MTKKLNNIEIEALKNMQKSLTKPLRIKWTTSLKFKQITIDLCNIDRTMMFKLYMRQSVLDEDNFSCGISFTKNGEDDITLARYNGSNHVHVNKSDGQRFEFQCHIHQANEESFKVSKKIEHHAIATNRYTNLQGAIQCVIQDFAIINLDISQFFKQGGLFDDELSRC